MPLSPPRLSGYVAMAAAAALSVWLVAARGGGPDTDTLKIGPSAAATVPATTTVAAPKLLSAAGLGARARSLGQPVYWAGSEPGTRYELTRDAAGNVVVRYAASTAAREGLTVATIPFRGAFAATEDLASKPGASSQRLPDGGLLYYRADRPSTYVAYPRLEYLIEIDAPSPAQARKLVRAGRVRPLG